jgi:Flp pilus assembly protein TadG
MKTMLIRKKSGCRRQNDRGQALPEFAVVLPVLALLLFAIIQYGFIFSAFMTLRHAAHMTARAISLAGFDSSSSSNVTAVAMKAISPPLDPAKLGPVVVNQSDLSGFTSCNVKLTYALPLIMKFIVPWAGGNTLSLSSEATYRKN